MHLNKIGAAQTAGAMTCCVVQIAADIAGIDDFPMLI